MSSDRGSASIWVLATGLVVLAFGYAVTLRGLAVLTRHRADAAADLAALAAADRIGVGGDPCSAARNIAGDNHAVLTGCTPDVASDGRSGTVRVTVRVRAEFPVVGDVETTSTARAGRLPGSYLPASTRATAAARSGPARSTSTTRERWPPKTIQPSTRAPDNAADVRAELLRRGPPINSTNAFAAGMSTPSRSAKSSRRSAPASAPVRGVFVEQGEQPRQVVPRSLCGSLRDGGRLGP